MSVPVTIHENFDGWRRIRVVGNTWIGFRIGYEDLPFSKIPPFLRLQNLMLFPLCELEKSPLLFLSPRLSTSCLIWGDVHAQSTKAVVDNLVARPHNTLPHRDGEFGLIPNG